MKTCITAIVVGLCISSPLLAQASEKPKTPQATKIAFINLKVVFEKYDRVKEWQKVLEKDLEPYRKAKRLIFRDDGQPWGRAPDKRELVKLRKEINDLIEEKYSDKTELFHKDLQIVIDAVRKAYGYDVVLSYGVPNFVDPWLFSGLPEARHVGGLVPLHIGESLDITEITAYNLNCYYRRLNEKK